MSRGLYVRFRLWKKAFKISINICPKPLPCITSDHNPPGRRGDFQRIQGNGSEAIFLPELYEAQQVTLWPHSTISQADSVHLTPSCQVRDHPSIGDNPTSPRDLPETECLQRLHLRPNLKRPPGPRQSREIIAPIPVHARLSTHVVHKPTHSRNRGRPRSTLAPAPRPNLSWWSSSPSPLLLLLLLCHVFYIDFKHQ